MGVSQFWHSRLGSLDNLSAVTSSVQDLNLNLSLIPPNKGKAVIDLNVEPPDEEGSPDTYLDMPSNLQSGSSCSTIPKFNELFPSIPPDLYLMAKDTLNPTTISSNIQPHNTSANIIHNIESLAHLNHDPLSITPNPHPDIHPERLANPVTPAYTISHLVDLLPQHYPNVSSQHCPYPPISTTSSHTSRLPIPTFQIEFPYQSKKMSCSFAKRGRPKDLIHLSYSLESRGGGRKTLSQ